MHSFLNKETGCVVIGRAWEGVAMTHRPVIAGRLGDQTNPVRPLRWRVKWTPPPEGYLANYKLLTKKEEQHLAFSERGQRVRTPWPFDASNFCSAFHKIFVILAKFHVITDIFFIQNKISIYMILSFFDYVHKCKKVNLCHLCRLEIPHPTLLSEAG